MERTMTKARRDFHSDYAPRGMRLERAAAYLDMSTSSFLRLIEEGLMPAGHEVRGMKIWDRHEIDTAFEELKRTKKDRLTEILGV
jgi:predicted DNA-binding transcriptional regulator AlpA